MPFFDMPLEQLRDYKPERDEPADFDAFWKETLDEARQHPLNATFEPLDLGLKMIETYDVTFNGFGGQPIKGWFLLPSWSQPPLPTVVNYIGYGGGRAHPINWLLWPNVGYACLVMDTRGQGSSWSKGDTADTGGGGSPSLPGFMTQGIFEPKTYYYRRVLTDAIRAVETAQTSHIVDKTKIAVAGTSQGGGIAIAVAGLLKEAISYCMPNVPFLSHFRRAIGLTDQSPYYEITRFLRIHRDAEEQVFKTLSYFDAVNFATRITAESLYSTALMDMVCPPSTVFAAYNHTPGQKEMMVYRYNEHEGGADQHLMEQVKFLQARWDN